MTETMHRGRAASAKKLIGVDYEFVATRVCRNCRYDLPLGYFAQAGSQTCITCNSAKARATAWTTEQMDTLIRAARAALDLWPRYFDMWTEEDLVLWRALLAAIDRRDE